MKCRFIDSRLDFFAILAEKLGAEFPLLPTSFDEEAQLVTAEVLIVGLPSLDQPRFQASLADLQRAVRNPAHIPVIAFLATSERQVSQIALAAGAYDFFRESGSMEELRIVLRRAAQFHELNRELHRLRQDMSRVTGFSSLVGADQKMTAVFQFASRVAITDAAILVTGETGTGKELMARAIHDASSRSAQPFVAVACSSLPETLIEAELFGHERGAFTGANSMRRGRFEAAARGTIFLDEIGDLTPGLQVKLLRVLQEHTFERLGSNSQLRMEARVICATNRSLPELVKAGLFRADLYYRLNTIEIKLPALRERRDDIALLAHSFLRQYAEKHNRPARRISSSALAALQEYAWPGNVRELQHVVERAVVICDDPEIMLEHLPFEMCASWEQELGPSFDDEVRQFKRRLIQRVLLEFDNNKLQAARSLKIARSSLHRLIDELHVNVPPRMMD